MTSARDEIIETTCALLEVQGYHATGLNQIIKESGSPKGSLYYYFPGGKEELTEEALRHVGVLVRERIVANLALTQDAAGAVRDFIMNVAHNVTLSGYKAGGPITTVAMETASTSERLREVCDSIYQSWQEAFAARLITSGIAEDRAWALAAVIISALEGGIILARTRQSAEPLERIALHMSLLVQMAMAGS